MSHEMPIIRTVAKMLDLQKVIKIWQHGDIKDGSDKMPQQNYDIGKERQVCAKINMCFFTLSIAPNFSDLFPLLSHLLFPFHSVTHVLKSPYEICSYHG